MEGGFDGVCEVVEEAGVAVSVFGSDVRRGVNLLQEWIIRRFSRVEEILADAGSIQLVRYRISKPSFLSVCCCFWGETYGDHGVLLHEPFLRPGEETQESKHKRRSGEDRRDDC